MKNIKKLSLIAMFAMTILSLTNLFGVSISQFSIFLGVAFFFINKSLEKQPMRGSGLDFKAIGTSLKDKKLWIWLVMPIIVDTISIVISKSFLPEYIEFETKRAGEFVAVEISISSILLFFVFALGEEIAWRAFFQQQLCKTWSIIPVLLISSLLFALGHLSEGDTKLVIFGLFFTFINSILYGVIFHKTKNAWVSALAHYAANMFEVIVYVLI